jgi:hypothetical protein
VTKETDMMKTLTAAALTLGAAVALATPAAASTPTSCVAPPKPGVELAPGVVVCAPPVWTVETHHPLSPPAGCEFYNHFTRRHCRYWDVGFKRWTVDRPFYWHVHRGDTMWSIAVRAYGARHGEQWGHGTNQHAGHKAQLIVAEAVREFVPDPTAIVAGDILFIPTPN